MFSLPQDKEESPTVRESPSGKWICDVDRASRRLEALIGSLEGEGDVADIAAELRAIHELVNGRGS
jgi:hypothetical protein